MATLRRDHHALIIEPACPDVLDVLQTVEHVMISDPQDGSHLEAAPRRLYDGGTATAPNGDSCRIDVANGVTLAGLEPVVRRLLRNKGYDVHGTAPVPVLPGPDLDAIQASDLTVDDGMLDLVRHHDRGIVRYGHSVFPERLMAQLALAFPDLSIVVATASVSEAKAYATVLRCWLPNDVTLVCSGSVRANPKRIVVGNYEALLGGCMDIHRRGLLIALDADRILGERGIDVLHAAENARLLGFLPIERRLAPRDADHVRGFFGFGEACVPEHGLQPLSVDVVFEQVTGGAPLPGDLDDVDLYRRAVWHDAVFNRRIARLANALHEKDRQGLGQFKRVLRAIRGRRIDRVAILVENVEHGLILARRLPGWHVITGPDVYAKGLKKADRDLLMAATPLSGDNFPTIFTLAAIDQLDPRDFDVLIRADAGAGLPPLAPGKLIVSNDFDHRLLLVDFDDRRHHELGRRTRQRRRAYREREWYSPGADPVEERVKDFLAARPKTSKA